MAKVPKPRVEIDVEQVEALASRGLTQEQIADALGIARSTLWAQRKSRDQIEQAIKRGHAKGISNIANVLYTEATQNKNITAAIFYMKARAGWRETDQRILTGIDDGPVQVANVSETIRRKLIPEAFED